MAVVKFHRYKQMQQPNDCNTIDPSQLTRQFVWHYLNIEPELVQDLIKTEMRTIAWPWDRKYVVDYSGKRYGVGAKGEYFCTRKLLNHWCINLDWMQLAEKGLTEADVAYTQHLGDLEELQGEWMPDSSIVDICNIYNHVCSFARLNGRDCELGKSLFRTQVLFYKRISQVSIPENRLRTCQLLALVYQRYLQEAGHALQIESDRETLSLTLCLAHRWAIYFNSDKAS